MKSSKNKQNNLLYSKKRSNLVWLLLFTKSIFLKSIFSLSKSKKIEKRAFTKYLLILHPILHLLRYYNCIANDQQE